MDTMTLAVSYHEILVGLLTISILFVSCRFISAYIDQWVAWKFRAKHGHECDCDAMEAVKKDIPIIIEKQATRDKDIADIKTAIALNTQVTTRLDKNIDNLFQLFEEEWKDEIKELKLRKVKNG